MESVVFIFVLWFLVPALFALHSLNKDRSNQVQWGDCFLRAFTKAVKIFGYQLVVYAIIVLGYYAYDKITSYKPFSGNIFIQDNYGNCREITDNAENRVMVKQYGFTIIESSNKLCEWKP